MTTQQKLELLQYQKVMIDEKMGKIRNEKEKKDLEECTFKPNIN